MLRFLRRLALAGGVLALILVACALLTHFAQADPLDPGWLVPNGLTIRATLPTTSVPSSINGNVDCFQVDSLNCAVNTNYGLATANGTVKLGDSADYLPVYSQLDDQQHFIPIPNSDTVISYTTQPVYGFYLYLTNNFTRSINLVDGADNGHYQINKPPNYELSDDLGRPLSADYASISFSQDGRWMVVSEPNNAILRVNLDTFQVTAFAPGFNYTIGLNPVAQTAISDDGRYVAVSSNVFGRFAVYDLNTCDKNALTPTCQSRDLQSFMASQIPNYLGVSHIRFTDDETLDFYTTYGDSDKRSTLKTILSDSPGTTTHQLGYLAMGDSYISGEGAFDYQPGTDTSDNNCHLSLLSYPYLLGQDLNFDSYHSVACSGALTDDIINTASNYQGQAKPKTKRSDFNDNQTDKIISDFQPGYIDQLDFVSTYQPQAITLSVGGNDIGFSAKLRACLSPGTCYGTFEDRLEFVREVNQNFDKLVSTYSQIKNVGAPDARVYVVGYPQIAKVGGDCGDNVHMDSDELAFTQQAISYMDTVIKAAAAKAGVDYVDTQDALDGFRLCEAKPGALAVNGVTAGNDSPGFLHGPIGNESYHPNEFGHQLLEQAILANTDHLTDSMPTPNLTAAPPAESGLTILDAPHSGRPVNIAQYDQNISDDVIFKQTTNSISVDGDSHSLPAGANLQAVLHSDEVDLGSFTTDANGNLTGQITIPSDVPAGYHTLHFYGSDLTGHPIDIYKIVYVADSPTTIDSTATTPDTKADSPSQTPASNTTVTVPSSNAQQSPAVDQPKISGDQSAPIAAKPQVLGDKTTASKPTQTSTVQPQIYGTINKPDPKTLLAAAGAGVFIALSYAAYKFRD